MAKRKSSHVICRQLCNEEMSRVIIPLHAMTGCDSNLGFFGHGKKKLYEKCLHSMDARNLLRECGNSLPLSEDTMVALKTFVIKYVYNDSKSKTMCKSRALKWKNQKKCQSKTSPDDDLLELHCMRANYLSYIQKKYCLTTRASPIGNGWHLIDGKCRTLRFRNPELPATLASNSLKLDDLPPSTYEEERDLSGTESDTDADLSDYE